MKAESPETFDHLCSNYTWKPKKLFEAKKIKNIKKYNFIGLQPGVYKLQIIA